MTEPTPPTDPVVVSPELLASVTAWINSVFKTAIKEALTDLTEEVEGPLWLQFTAWANGWFEQLRTDYSPGGVLEATLKNAAHDIHMLTKVPPLSESDPEVQD